MRKRRGLSPLTQKERKRSGSSFDGCPQGNGRTQQIAPIKSAVCFPQPRQRFFHPRQSAGIEYPAALKMIHSGLGLCFPETSAILPSAKTAGKPMAERRHQFPGGTLPRSHTDGRFRRGMARFAVLRVGRGSPKPGSLCLSGSVCCDPSHGGGQVPCGRCW